jgi:threonine/homoserine/homoserine lactone efflux protein
MNEVLALVSAAIISFWGSLQLGPVNVCVIQTALAHGKRQALIVAFGGVLPELFYSSLAVFGNSFIQKSPLALEIANWAIVPVLLALGIYTFIQPMKKMEVKPSQGSGFLKGFLLASLNPQLFPFWLGVLVFVKQFINLEKGTFVSPYPFFIAGTAIGAWLLLYLFTKLSLRYRDLLTRIIKFNMNKVVGSLYVLLAILGLVKIIF